jgi:hypothetical protein
MNIFGKKIDHATSNVQYERCEIAVTEPKFEGTQFMFRFFARASSPKERYTAMVSKQSCPGKQPNYDNKETQLALNNLKIQLISEGWELLTEKGSMWYNLRFRRIYKP